MPTSSRFKIVTAAADEPNNPPVEYAKIVQALEDRVAGASQLVANRAAIDAIPAAEVFNGKSVVTLDDQTEWRRVAGAWVVWNRPSKSYTPSLYGMSLGSNGAIIARYSITNGKNISLDVQFRCGTDSNVGDEGRFGAPGLLYTPPISQTLGQALLVDTSAGRRLQGVVEQTQGMMRVMVLRPDGSYMGAAQILRDTTPWAWANNDYIIFHVDAFLIDYLTT